MKKIIAILAVFAVVLTAGITVAYYNTKTFGFDENAKIFTKDSEKVTFLDFEIYYDDVNDIYDGLKDYAQFHISV